MKVLVLSPEKKDKESRERRELIVKTLEDLKVKLLNPAYGRPPVKKTFPPQLFPQMFYKSEVKFLEKADLIIADLTEPDFKIGFLVAEALKQQKNIITLVFQKDLLIIGYLNKLKRKFEKICLKLGKKFKYWIKIDCVDKKGKIIPMEKIQQKIIKILKKKTF